MLCINNKVSCLQCYGEDRTPPVVYKVNNKMVIYTKHIKFKYSV